jgi:hypothetical protein
MLAVDYQRDGYAIVRGMFAADEVAFYIRHYTDMLERGDYPADLLQNEADHDDPLVQYPRMLQMHRVESVSMDWLIDLRIRRALNALLGADPYAVQTMIYFKAPGSRGQALHQDQFYLRAKPGTCMAAWMALDPCDEENGCLRVVPGTQDLPVMCTEAADYDVSFSDVEVPLPEGYAPVPVLLEPGDVLFFNGSLVHGSLPNRSTDRFRRALIGHYVSADATEVTKGYHPVYNMDGEVVEIGAAEGGGLCGQWVNRDGSPVAELSETPLTKL